VNVVGGGSEAGACTHLTRKLETALPFVGLSPQNVRLVLGLFVVFKRELDVELQPIPYALPNANPLVRSTVVARNPAASIDPCGRTTGRRSAPRCSFEKRGVFDATRAVPGAPCWHAIETAAEDVAKLLAAVAIHELWGIAKLVAHHACIIAAVILEGVVVVDNHGGINLGDLLLVLDGILG
jgi:hypothetical protein